MSARSLILAICLFTVFAFSSMERAVAADQFDQYGLEHPRVKLGVEVLFSNPKYFDLIKGKRVGLITNPTGVDSKLNSTVDLMHDNKDVKLAKLFGPEHGVRGNIHAGVKVSDDIDTKTGVMMYSLYGKTRRPPKAFLEGLDVMVYDIQDVGSRSYTYIYSMAYAMEECGKLGIPFIVLDRPNPCGNIVSGNILNEAEGTSFVGLYAIPYQYGMTPGEIAKLFNEKFNKAKCDLTVVPMEGYKRDMLQWDTGLPFVPSSPNIPRATTAMYYNLTGIIGELDDVSIGVGYPLAFEIIAAPYIDRDQFVSEIRAKNLPGLMVMPITIVPFASKFKGETVNGAQFFITDYRKIQPVEAQIHFMEILQKLYPKQGMFAEENKRQDMFDKVMGTASIRRRILAGEKAEAIIADYQKDVAEFEKVRKQYLIYK